MTPLFRESADRDYKYQQAVHFWHHKVPNEFKISRSMRAIFEDIPNLINPREAYIGGGANGKHHAGHIVISGLRKSGMTTTGILDFLHYELHVFHLCHELIHGMLVTLNETATRHTMNLLQSSPLSHAFNPKNLGEFDTHLGSRLTVVSAGRIGDQMRSHSALDWYFGDVNLPEKTNWQQYPRVLATRVIDSDPPYTEHTLLPDAPSCDWKNETYPEDYYAG